MVAAINIACFFMVLREKLWWALVMITVSTTPVFIGVIYTIRMWIFTNDPLLMRESPAVLAVSSWFERPRMGAYVNGALVTCASIATLLAFIDEVIAMRFIAVVGSLLALLSSAIVLVCGRSLIRAINRSLQQQQRPSSHVEGTKAIEGRGQRLDQSLLAAKKKVALMMFNVVFVAITGTALISVVMSKYGPEAPLLLFSVPANFSSPLFLSINVQLHSGRSNLSRRGFVSSTRVAVSR